ncbi:MAG: hypothetical protein JWR84_599 [Caulobacter sp.]|nr:hypothetical protein [Caulobacter sp.]
MRRWIVMGLAALVVAIVALIGLATAFVALQGLQTPKDAPDYVALGSSYAAGAGLGKLQKGSPLLCARSVNGYPQQLGRLLGVAPVDMACGGAVTKNVLRGGQVFQGPQLRVITADTHLVTLTVGGNDVGYVGDLSLLAARKDDSLFGWLARTLWKGPRANRPYANLHDELLATLRAIQAKAPNARIVVATYPAVLPPTGTCARLGLTADEADQMRAVAARLAETTAAAAREGGVVLVDMNALGTAQNACAADPWTTGWRDAGPAPFHPTLAGAKATAEAVARAIEQ